MELEHLIDVKLQPIFNVVTKTVGFAEVLLRAVDNRTSTFEVLNTFKKSNRSADLDKYILSRACKFIRQHRSLQVKLAVNITRQTIEIKDIHNEIASVIRKHGVNPSRIIIELNENTVYNSEIVTKNVNGLIECGVGVAIDDFGKGNTSLDNIGKFNVDIIKFDKDFLNIKDGRGVQMIANMVDRMHMVGIDTVIEGVETIEQLRSAESIGYGNIQGFILAKPMTTGAYTEMYAN